MHPSALRNGAILYAHFRASATIFSTYSSSSKTILLPVGSAEIPANPYRLGTYGSGATCEHESELVSQNALGYAGLNGQADSDEAFERSVST